MSLVVCEESLRMSALVDLCLAGELAGVVAALGRGEEPTSRGDWAGRGGRGAPCLVKAAFAGHVGVVEELLRHPSLRPNALLHLVVGGLPIGFPKAN